jgi:hypothetical protein
MKRFLIKCGVFLFVLFIVDKSLLILRNTRPQKELDRRLEYIITGKIRSDIIVLGSSRGARDIVASQLADSLHTTAFNLSYPGSDIHFHEYLLASLIKCGNMKPKILILALDDPAEVKEDSTIKFRFDRLYPLVKYGAIRNTLIEYGEKNRVLSDLFIVHQLSLSNFDPRKKHFTRQDTILKDGSMPISWQSDKFNRSFHFEPVVYNRNQEKPDKVQSLRNIIGMCHDNNITVLMACTPNFNMPSIGFSQRINQLAGRNNCVMEYDTTNTVYRNAEYYFDDAHLKLNGATIYTSEISAYIKEHNLLN